MRHVSLVLLCDCLIMRCLTLETHFPLTGGGMGRSGWFPSPSTQNQLTHCVNKADDQMTMTRTRRSAGKVVRPWDNLRGYFEVLKDYYPLSPVTPENDRTRWASRSSTGKLQLKCNQCGVKICRWAPRKHGNPECGVCHWKGRNGPIQDLTYKTSPFLALIKGTL